MHWQFFLTCVTISCVVLKLEEKIISILYWLLLILAPKNNNKQKLAYKLIFLLSFFFLKNKEHKEFAFKYCFFLYGKKCEEGKSLPTMSNFLPQSCVFLPNKNPENCVKTTNKNWVPNQTETTRHACLADKHRITERREGSHKRGR